MTKTEIKKVIKNFDVLFVDDEEFVLNTMKETLPILFKSANFADNGLDAIKMCKDCNIDFVITDISMPKMNGITMVQNIKEFLDDIKVIFVSGHNESEYIDVIRELQSSLIVKPINSTDLYKALEEVIQKHNLAE